MKNPFEIHEPSKPLLIIYNHLHNIFNNEQTINNILELYKNDIKIIISLDYVNSNIKHKEEFNIIQYQDNK